MSFGTGILDGIDPNPENFVCASILHTSTHQVGCLMRLEPNKQVQASICVHRCFILSLLLYAPTPKSILHGAHSQWGGHAIISKAPSYLMSFSGMSMFGRN